jgi:hypothetical protein
MSLTAGAQIAERHFALVCGERDAAAAEGGVDLRRPAMVLQAIFWLGWGMALLSSFVISHFELAGISEVFAGLRNRATPACVHYPFLYRRVRHPPHFGFLLGWATPVITIGHLLFAGATTAYIRIATQHDERDLIDFFADQYRRDCKEGAILIPLPNGASVIIGPPHRA